MSKYRLLRSTAMATAIAFLILVAYVAQSSAQVVTGSGTVTLKQADDTTALVKDAVVIFYRTDITGRYQTKTDKSGRYVYAGLPFTGVFTIV
ncbi:MAG: hypothetical protein ACRD63_01965, partial [Pyrinomonadaceae bacterium]